MAWLYHNGTDAALYEDDRLVEYWPGSSVAGVGYHFGAIVKARITHIMKGQNRAICALPNGQKASLRLSKATPLAGQTCIVTLTALPRQAKPWMAELGIVRAGRLVVLHHGAAFVRVSHKSDSQADDNLMKRLQEARPEGWGLVLKRAGQAAGFDEIMAEIEMLLAALPSSNLTALNEADSPEADPCLYQGDDALMLGRMAAPSGCEVILQQDALFWEEIDDKVRESCQKEIILASGARLMIEATHALIAIDVDSASSRLSPAELARKVAPEIMRLIRLLSLSGIIVVDMPRLGAKQAQEMLAVMRQEAQRDIRYPDVLGISRAGLIEIVVRHRLTYLGDRLAPL